VSHEAGTWIVGDVKSTLRTLCKAETEAMTTLEKSVNIIEKQKGLDDFRAGMVQKVVPSIRTRE